MTFLDISVFFAVSFVAAANNAVAGGGTFLTFPVFILNGLSALEANIMSTIALWPGSLASAHGYRGVREVDGSLKTLLAIGIIGGATGALLLLATPELTFERMVPWLMLVATLIFTFGKRLPRHFHEGGKIRTFVGMTTISVYGGYFGGGIGILTLALLQLAGRKGGIHRMNALKVLLVGAINAATFVIFVVSGRVVWELAPVVIAGALAGGYLGARLALKVPPEILRALVIAVAVAMTVYFFVKNYS